MFIFVVKLHKNNETEKLFLRFFINVTKVKNSVKQLSLCAIFLLTQNLLFRAYLCQSAQHKHPSVARTSQ